MSGVFHRAGLVKKNKAVIIKMLLILAIYFGLDRIIVPLGGESNLVDKFYVLPVKFYGVT